MTKKAAMAILLVHRFGRTTMAFHRSLRDLRQPRLDIGSVTTQMSSLDSAFLQAAPGGLVLSDSLTSLAFEKGSLTLLRLPTESARSESSARSV
jgi:hypothetical protein